MLGSFQVGQKPKVTASFKDASGTLADPTTVTFEIHEPDGTIQTLTGVSVTKEGVGQYSVAISLTQEGRWFVKAIGTQNVDASLEDYLLARATVNA